MDSLTKDIFVTNTENRSLTSAEKISDFNKLNDYIIRNYAIDNNNEENYKNLIDQTDIYKKELKIPNLIKNFMILFHPTFLY